MRNRDKKCAAFSGVLAILAFAAPAPAAADDVPFLRGDVNGDGKVSISDGIAMLLYGYNGEPQPACLDAADLNDGHFPPGVDMADFIVLINDLFFLDIVEAQIPEPFPEVGADPTPDELGCASYSVIPPRETEDLVRVGDVQAFPGQEIEIPIYLMSAVPVVAFQLFLSFDPQVLTVEEREDNADFEGTIYEILYPDRVAGPGWNSSDHQPDLVSVHSEPAGGLLSIAVIGNFRLPRFGIPPGTDLPAIKIRATVSPDAAPGTYTLDLTNGPEGQGVKPPYYLKNELTHLGAARFVSEFPRRQAGRIGIVEDINIFVRGDSNGDGSVDISDPICLLGFLFLGGPAPGCADAADADDSGILDITDAVTALTTLFLGSGAGGIAQPYPLPDRDPTFDNLPPCL
jgi:hypothetical protein